MQMLGCVNPLPQPISFAQSVHRLRDANLAKRGIASDEEAQLKALEEHGKELLEKVKKERREKETKSGGTTDAKNPEEELLGPVMGSIQQAMEFEDTDLGRKMMAKVPKDGATVEQEGESDFGDWELIGDAPNLSEESAYENVSEVERTIEVSFNKDEEGEERDKQGKF